MPKLKSPAGVIEFEPIPYKQENLIKVNLSDIGDDNGEGVWACVSDEDKIKHDADVKDDYFIAVVCNTALNFLPNCSLGLHIVAKFNGKNRPVSSIYWVDYSLPENRIWVEGVDDKRWNFEQ
jgi:hypothetical protein